MDHRLTPDLVVDLELDGGWKRTATVVTVGLDGIELAPADRAPMLPGDLRWAPAVLQWRIDGAVIRTEGVVHRQEGRLRMVPIATPTHVQRRQFARVRAEVPTAVICGGERRNILVRTVDLSVGGMLLRSGPGLTVGERVDFALDLDGEIANGEGKIVRGTAKGEQAVEFLTLHGSSEQTLSRFVAARQRQRLALR